MRATPPNKTLLATPARPFPSMLAFTPTLSVLSTLAAGGVARVETFAQLKPCRDSRQIDHTRAIRFYPSYEDSTLDLLLRHHPPMCADLYGD